MQVEREIVFPESPAELWEALTEPERLEEWFASEVELDPRPGGAGIFRWAEGEERDGAERRATVRDRTLTQVLDSVNANTVSSASSPTQVPGSSSGIVFAITRASCWTERSPASERG